MSDLVERLRTAIHPNFEAADRIEELEAQVAALEAFLFKRSHMCSGRDCVGIYQEPTGSLSRCDDCNELAALKEET